MKFYVHLEEPDCSFTVVFDTSNHNGAITVEEVLQIFKKEFDNRYLGHCKHKYDFVLTQRRSVVLPLTFLPGTSHNADFYVLRERRGKNQCKGSSEDDISQKLNRTSLDTQALHHNIESPTKKTKLEVLKEGRQWLASKMYHRVAALYDGWLSSNSPPDPEMCATLGRIYLDAGRPEVSERYIHSGLKCNPNCHQLRMGNAECLIARGEPQRAVDKLLEYVKDLRSAKTATLTAQKHEIQLLLCKAYQSLDHTDMAIVMAQGILRENPIHQGALLEFAKLTFDLGDEQGIQALGIILTQLAKSENQADWTVRSLMTRLCQRTRGLICLERAMGEAWSSPAALVMVANILKDGGAVDLSCVLLKRAVDLDPTNHEAVLGYVHLMEMLSKPWEAIQHIIMFCRTTSRVPVFTQTVTRVLHQLQAVKQPTDSTDSNKTSPDTEQISSDPPQTSISVVPQPYTEADLYILAIWYTAVKILYTLGELETVTALCELLDPMYKAGDQHLTDIRNEAAFYRCISKIVRECRPLTSADVSCHVMYVIGDSHCLPLAWRTIKYKGNHCTMIPVLSTGTKIWHLRPESRFYTKTSFHNAVSSIPGGAAVILLLGEIDCRESLLSCVERCRYDTLEDAIHSLVGIYLSIIAELQRSCTWTIYIHPVPPVLDITRETVMAFNGVMKQRLPVDSGGSTMWLDIAEDLLICSRRQLKEDYDFDGTHLGPKYVRLLEIALEKMIPPQPNVEPETT